MAGVSAVGVAPETATELAKAGSGSVIPTVNAPDEIADCYPSSGTTVDRVC